ncbi:hypothetical protein N4P33_19160 [Streptomyces sp. 15-116A]|uniref:hypothetical protein n=1 Tax=Streptomyces sp. 15-116A TaxID=2259035 RepID=UPI0021B42C0E|nr:hypothetical protein [Streptomyces sp. 15-116A]MCT7354253.1 hypothetical protein [Streptomyces sp. 15-116A]
MGPVPPAESGLDVTRLVLDVDHGVDPYILRGRGGEAGQHPGGQSVILRGRLA